MNAQDTRVAELLAWQAETGRSLPMPVATVLELEDDGYIVDLVTGSAIRPFDHDGTVVARMERAVRRLERSVRRLEGAQ